MKYQPQHFFNTQHKIFLSADGESNIPDGVEECGREEHQCGQEEQQREQSSNDTKKKPANNETGKPPNFVGDLFIESSSAELF